MNDTLIAIAMGVLGFVPTAIVVAIAARQPYDRIDYSGWIPPDEIIEEAAVTLYFDAPGRELTP